MKLALIAFVLVTCHPAFSQLQPIGSGEQPQLSVDAHGIIRLVYGQENKIFYAVSNDNGTSFSKPEIIGEVNEMHLGMSRGPQLASSADYSIVTAIDKQGNIHSFRLDHRTGKWTVMKNLNDVEASAREGLMSITADEGNVFYAVWLDLREDRHNKIAFSTLTKSGSWSKNKVVYKSPDKTVCECCKPSVAVNGSNVSLMFRNWIDGSRDLYLLNSRNGGANFENPVKLGNGTWKLKGCPMDGGRVLMDKENGIHTVWQREGEVYYDQPGQPERKLANGRSCNLFGNETPFLTWQEGNQIIGQPLNGNRIVIGDGTAVSIAQLNDKTQLAVWEKNGEIMYRKL